MVTMTYSQQLKHPQWQRRRLEMLTGADFECTDCGDKDTMLHVHHKQYFKGRMAWEYADDELAVLCEKCHASEHRTAEALKQILAVENTPQIMAVIAGFLSRSENQDPAVIEQARKSYPLGFAYGFVASLLEFHEIDQIAEIAKHVVGLTSAKSEARPILERDKHYVGMGE